jgi:molybdate transport system substrate-binding protein
MRRHPGVIRLAVVAALVASACSTAATSAPAGASSSAAGTLPSTAAGGLTIYAAASLSAAFRDLAAAYRAATGTAITLSFDASSALEAQIEQGAPADILASADTANPGKLVKANLAAGTPVTFAGNALTIIVPGSGPTAVSSPRDLGKAGVKVIGAGDSVPITKYANQLIANLAKEPGYPADYAAQVKANTVSKEDNVSAVVAKVELGEGDGAIVYVTDAKGSSKVTPLPVPPGANVSATYGAVAVKASKHPDAAASFISWLAGPEARAILATYGFLPPS